MGWVILALLIIAALGLAVYLLRRRRAPTAELRAPRRPAASVIPSTASSAAAEDSYRVLVTMLLGDRLKADRLIEFEASKTPGASRAQCIDNAIELLRNDLRR